ncbi:MAG: pseudouridine synthase [Kiritimatiellia bacterium]
MILNREFVNEQSGVRLDAVLLGTYPTTTRAFVREAVEGGKVLVNGRRAAKGLKLRGGEQIAVSELLEAEDNLVRPNPAIRPRVVFEDAALLGLDKPAGLPVQPLSCSETKTLMNGVAARYPECIPLGDRPLMAGALHRIDADTSGLVLAARTAEAFEALRAQFTAQTVKKTYLALVEGSVAVGGTLENDLVHDPSLPFCRMIDARHNRLCEAEKRKLRPLHAVTNFKPIGHTTVENEERTLLEVTIYTGVTHQIRAQLALAGFHIVNDRLYGAFAVENQTGHGLHAWAAAFRHPVSGDEMEIRTSLPDWARI